MQEQENKRHKFDHYETIGSFVFEPFIPGGGPVFVLTTRYRRDRKHVLAYRLSMREPGEVEDEVIFEGEDFSCAPSHAIDSNECIASLMGFLTLGLGDTDEDYFANYTERQKRYCDLYAESLSLEVLNRYGKG